MNFLKHNDKLIGINDFPFIAKSLDRTAFTFLVLMVIFAPHSIAASQTAFILGILFSFARLFLVPRPNFPASRLTIPLLTFVGWTFVTCLFAYFPLVALDKLRGVGLFLVLYFAYINIRNLRALRFLVLALFLSCMVSVLWTPVERILGRGVEIHGISPDSPLKKALLWEGDALLKANGKKVRTPEELVFEIENTEVTKVDFYRPDFYFTVEVKRSDLLTGDALQKLGIESWKKSRNWRAQGFFSHFVTFAEVLQLIVSLVFGLFIASVADKTSATDKTRKIFSLIPFRFSIFLFFCLCAMALALLLTVTRGAQLSFLISAVTIVFLLGNRKLTLLLILTILPIAIAGLLFLQQSRQVGFFDKTDTSTTYRMTVYQEGIDLWLDNPRHFFFGIGMDAVSNKEFREKWKLFGNGTLPVSHFHSTPIQLLVERGLFGFILWLSVLIAYLCILYQGLKKQLKRCEEFNEIIDFPESKLIPLNATRFRIGILLGCFGATVGFFTSSLVHYNFGDGEVVLMLFLLMGFGLFAATEPKIAETGN